MIEHAGDLTYMDAAYFTSTARRAIRDEARAAKVKAKYQRWQLIVKTGTDQLTLLAWGQRADGYEFAVRVAI